MPSESPSPSEPRPAQTFSAVAGEALAGERLDKALATSFPDLSRSRLAGLIDNDAVRVNGSRAKASSKVRPGDRLEVTVPQAVPSSLLPEKGDFRILFEDTALLVVSKPPGMVVHPGAGVSQGTLAAALLAHCGTLSEIGGVTRPGIVHRLDKGTSGLMVVAKNDAAHRSLSAQFKARSVSKIYTAICLGTPRPPRGSVALPIGRDPRHRQRMAIVDDGRAARTDYEVSEVLGPASVVRLTLHSGRTHQIRVHMKAIGCPLAGDTTYGAASFTARLAAPFRETLARFPRPALHSARLGFSHPVTGAAMHFEDTWPEDLESLRHFLRTAIGPGEKRGKA